MKNLLLVTFAWLMMMSIIGSIVYTMLYVVENYSYGNNESIQYLWCCFTGVLLIPAYKGVYYIHSLWLKMLKEFREGDSGEDDSKEIPFFKEPTSTVSVNITEYPFVDNRKKNIPAPPSLEEINETIRNIRSSANQKLSQIKTEDITKPTKDSSYFAQKYTEEKSILVDTIFAKEKQSQTPQAAPDTTTSKEESAAKAEAEAILKPKATATSEEKSISKSEAATTANHEAKKEDTSHKGKTTATKHTHKDGKKHYHKKGRKR